MVTHLHQILHLLPIFLRSLSLSTSITVFSFSCQRVTSLSLDALVSSASKFSFFMTGSLSALGGVHFFVFLIDLVSISSCVGVCLVTAFKKLSRLLWPTSLIFLDITSYYRFHKDSFWFLLVTPHNGGFLWGVQLSLTWFSFPIFLLFYAWINIIFPVFGHSFPILLLYFLSSACLLSLYMDFNPYLFLVLLTRLHGSK